MPIDFEQMRQHNMGQTYQPTTKSINGVNFVNGRTTDTRDSLSKKQSNNYLNTRNQITLLSQNQSRKGNNNHSEYQNQNFDYDKMMTMHNQMQNMSLTNKVGMNQDTKALS